LSANTIRKAKKFRKILKNLGKVNPHAVCEKLGKPMARSRVDPSYRYKCSKCNVSYSEKQKHHFFRKNKCPCCHLALRTRKTIQQKRMSL